MDLLQPVGQRGQLQIDTVLKSPFADGGDVVGDILFGQSGTAVKSRISDGHKRIGQSDVGQCGAVGKGVVRQSGHALGHFHLCQ